MSDDEAMIAKIEAEQAQRDRLRPIRMLRPWVEQVDREPETVEWAELIDRLQAAIKAAKHEASA